MISWKLDGLTVVLTYQNGELAKAVTRGNGVIGEVITNNVKVFKNVPLKIPYQGELVLRGEAVISYKDFEKINDEIEDWMRNIRIQEIFAAVLSVAEQRDHCEEKCKILCIYTCPCRRRGLSEFQKISDAVA